MAFIVFFCLSVSVSQLLFSSDSVTVSLHLPLSFPSQEPVPATQFSTPANPLLLLVAEPVKAHLLP